MNIQNFLTKAIPDIISTIKMPNGDDSGEKFHIINPASGHGESILSAYKAALAEFQSKHKDLIEAGNKSNDFSEYNKIAGPFFSTTDKDFAVALLCGWTMDDEFSKESAYAIFDAAPYMVKNVIGDFLAAKELLEKK